MVKGKNDLDNYLKNYKLERYENIFAKFGVFLRTAESGIWVETYKLRDCEFKFRNNTLTIEYQDPILASAITARLLSSPWSNKRNTEIKIKDEKFKWEENFLQASVAVFNKIIDLAKTEKRIEIKFSKISTYEYYQQLVYFLDEPDKDDLENFEEEFARRR